MSAAQCALLALTLAVSPLAAYAQAEWYTELEVARDSALATGKPIFLDAYTTWCAPCKQMDKEVFAEPTTMTLLHAMFVPLKLDMESPGAARLKQQYDIGVFPTLLVFDEAGEMHRAVGYQSERDLYAFATLSTDDDRNFRGKRWRYLRGERTDTLLSQLAAYAKTVQHRDYPRYAYDWLVASGEWDTDAGRHRLLDAVPDVDHPLFDTLIARRTGFDEQFGAYVVDERIARLLETALYGEQAATPREAKRVLAKAYPTRADSTYLRHRMRVAREAGEAKRYGKLALKWQKRWPTDDPDELAELLYVFESRLEGWKTNTVAAWRSREEELRAASEDF